MNSFNQNIIKHKTGLLNLAAELGNISKACRLMGFSRDTFYRYQAARDAEFQPHHSGIRSKSASEDLTVFPASSCCKERCKAA